jgi:hypothetical protein
MQSAQVRHMLHKSTVGTHKVPRRPAADDMSRRTAPAPKGASDLGQENATRLPYVWPLCPLFILPVVHGSEARPERLPEGFPESPVNCIAPDPESHHH